MSDSAKLRALARQSRLLALGAGSREGSDKARRLAQLYDDQANEIDLRHRPPVFADEDAEA